MKDYSIVSYEAPFHQPSDDLRFLPVNVASALLGRNFYRDLPIYAAISVPYFKGGLPSEIIKIAESETDAFIKFNHLLNEKLGVAGMATSPEQLRDCVEEIKYEVANLRVEAKRVTKLKTLRDANPVNLTINVTALKQPDSEIAHDLAGAIGSSRLASVLDAYGPTANLEKSDVYFAFLLQDMKAASGKTKKLRPGRYTAAGR